MCIFKCNLWLLYMTRKSGFLVWCFILAMLSTFGQSKEELNRYSDSLYSQLTKIEDKEERALQLLELSFIWSDYETEKAFGFVDEAEILLGERAKTEYYQGILNFYRAAGNFDIDLQTAKEQYMTADRYLKKVEGKKKTTASRYRARLWASYGALRQREGEAHEYIEILLEKVIPIAMDIRDSALLGNNYQNVAMLLMNVRQHAKADDYYGRAMDLLQGREDAHEARFTLFVNAARNALLGNDLKRSRLLLDSAAKIIDVVPILDYRSMYHTVEGSYWQKQKMFDQAHAHFEKGLAIAKEKHDEDMVATILFDQFSAFQTNNQPALAMGKLREVLPYIEQKPSLRNKQMVYYNLAKTATQLGDYREATEWYEQHRRITDTLLKDRGEERTLELEEMYQATAKENELLRVKAENQQQQLSLQQTRLLAGILAFAMVVLAMLSFIWYNSLKNRKRLAAQREQLLQEELKNYKQQEKLNVFNAMLQGQERERSRIAKDLHDGLGGILAGVKLKLSAVVNTQEKENNKTPSSMELYSIIHQLDHSVNELRRIARNMMPESLLYMGLEASLQDLCSAIAHPNLQVEFQATNLRNNYSQPFLITVYRIVQELLTNAIKHSEATQIWVQCSEADGTFDLTVEDNGRGFNPQNNALRSDGIGLSNVRNRVEILNGHLEIDAAEGKGAAFHIQFKLND